ncbi:MAG: MFS transporter [Sphingomonadales bacterium]
MDKDIGQSMRARAMSPAQIMAVAICVVINMLDGFDVLAIAFVGPRLAAEWGLDPKTLGLLFSAGLFGMTIGSLVLAPMADLLGRRTVILGGLSLITIGMLLSALATGVTMLAALRLVTGIGIGTLFASLNTMTAEYASARRRSLAIGILVIGYPIGATLGGMLAVWLIAHFGWQSVFIFGGAASALMLPLVYLLLPESLDYLMARRPARALERVNKVLKRVRMAPLERLPDLATGVTASKSKSLLMVFSPAYLRGTLVICASYFSLMTSFYFILSWTPKVLVDLGLSEALGISGAVLINVGGIAGGLLLGSLAQRWDVRAVTATFMIGSFAMMVVFGLLPPTAHVLMLGAVGLGLAIMAAMAGLYALVPLIFPANIRNTGTGLAIGIGRLGATVGPYVAGLLIAAGWQRDEYYTVLGIPFVIAAILVFLIGPRGARRELD